MGPADLEVDNARFKKLLAEAHPPSWRRSGLLGKALAPAEQTQGHS
jgi:hypothetical protein